MRLLDFQLQGTIARVLFLVGVVSIVCLGQDDRSCFEEQLKGLYEGQVVAISADFSGGDAEEVRAWIGDSEWMPWGALLIDELRLKKKEVELWGRRRFLYLDSDHNLQVGTGTHKVKIRLRFSSGQYEKAVKLLGELLEFSAETVFEEAARNCDRLKTVLETKREEDAASKEDVHLGLGVYRSRQGEISHPLCLRCPNPEFPTASVPSQIRQARISFWALVNEQGRMACVKLEAADHAGMIISAVDALGTWHMAPAQREGSPVSTLIRVEVDLSRY